MHLVLYLFASKCLPLRFGVRHRAHYTPLMVTLTVNSCGRDRTNY